MAKIALPGILYGAVPLLSRHNTPREFTHILCDRVFYETIKPGQIIWSVEQPGKSWALLDARYKFLSGKPMHIYSENQENIPPDPVSFDDRQELEAYIDGHILGFGLLNDGGLFATLCEVTADGKNAFNPTELLLDGDVAAPGRYQSLIARDKSRPIPGRKAQDPGREQRE